MRWSDVDISFGPEDHPDTELPDRNLLFMVKILIGQHKVAKTLIDSGASLNLMMRNTFIEIANREEEHIHGLHVKSAHRHQAADDKKKGGTDKEVSVD
jgi:hypothetical protein